jgi:hypothetical protein
MSDTSIDNAFAAVAERGRPTERTIAATPSGVTRYLAAAAYTDKSFRDRAIEIDRAEFQAVAPELGIDAGMVVAHCHIARRREALRDSSIRRNSSIGLPSQQTHQVRLFLRIRGGKCRAEEFT